MLRVFLCILCITLVSSCSKKEQAENKLALFTEEYKVHHAQGFQVTRTADYTHISVRNPWDTTNLLQSYVLVDKALDLPTNLPKGVVVRTPLSAIATTSVIQCSILAALQSIAIVKGVCEPQYVNIEHIKKGVADGSITDLGMASSPSIESLILLSPEVVFSDPVTGQSQANIEKTKIPLVQTPDYTEPTPLGRAEWIRFYSLFIGKEALADSLFATTEKNYNKVKAMVAEVKVPPTVFTDTRYRGNWNMAGGQSYMANLLGDAGANYLWSDNESTTFVPLSFETVLEKAGNGDIWLIRYYAEEDMTYSSLEKEYKPYTYFKAFKEKNIYGCNTMYSKYFEDLPIHPDYILKDLANVFHPELFPGYVNRYYKKFEE